MISPVMMSSAPMVDADRMERVYAKLMLVVCVDFERPYQLVEPRLLPRLVISIAKLRNPNPSSRQAGERFLLSQENRSCVRGPVTGIAAAGRTVSTTK